MVSKPVRTYESFGRATPPAPRAMPVSAAIRLLTGGRAQSSSLLAYGNGRSYGDSCQNHSGTVVDMGGMNHILAFNPETGVMQAEAGTLLSDIIAYAAPHGFFPAVVPGTQYVTLGGAIANDVHGKNHHRRGSFGCHVEEFSLLRSDGRVHRCSAAANARLFWSTIGGMGLTGLILTATIRLMRVPSIDVVEQVTPFASVDAYFDLAEAADLANEYAVAWIDQLASGKGAGRGVLITGNHALQGAHTAFDAKARRSVPFRPPVNLLSRPFLKTFNAGYRWKKSRATERRTAHQGFFFPLDGVGNWNWLYGPRGLLQHQSVVPLETARKTIPALLEATRRAGQGSFLTVLKRFGSHRSPGILSFARPGYTLTLDFPNRGRSTRDLLDRLDGITVGAGGAVNPYKDARMSAETFGASFPEWQRLEVMRDPAFLSSFWARTAGVLMPSRIGMAEAAE